VAYTLGNAVLSNSVFVSGISVYPNPLSNQRSRIFKFSGDLFHEVSIYRLLIIKCFILSALFTSPGTCVCTFPTPIEI